MNIPSENTLEIRDAEEYNIELANIGLEPNLLIILIPIILFIQFTQGKIDLYFIFLLFFLVIFISSIFTFIAIKTGPTEKIIINNTDIMVMRRLYFKNWSRNFLLPLSSIASYSYQVSKDYENKTGFIRPSTKLDFFMFYLSPSNWYFKKYKSQKLVFNDLNKKTIGEIDLSKYYQVDIEKLLTFFRRE